MTKKEYLKSFVANGFLGFGSWFIFNFLSLGIYFFNELIVNILDYETINSSLFIFLILYFIVYIGTLLPSFHLGFAFVKKTGNSILDFVSLLSIRLLTIILYVWLIDYHNSIIFSNFSLATLDKLLVFADNNYFLFFDSEWLYLLNLVPFVVTFIGFQIGKKRRKDKQEEIKE